MWATVDGVRVCSAYFPNGQRVDSDKWAYKLAWMDRLRRTLDRLDPATPFVIAGDFNVAPERARRGVSRALARLRALPPGRPRRPRSTSAHGAWRTPSARVVGDVQGPYSWWDYRALAFPKGDGVRIDHVFATPTLAATATAARVDRDERKGESPSDHAPVIVTFGNG